MGAVPWEGDSVTPKSPPVIRPPVSLRPPLSPRCPHVLLLSLRFPPCPRGIKSLHVPTAPIPRSASPNIPTRPPSPCPHTPQDRPHNALMTPPTPPPDVLMMSPLSPYPPQRPYGAPTSPIPLNAPKPPPHPHIPPMSPHLLNLPTSSQQSLRCPHIPHPT